MPETVRRKRHTSSLAIFILFFAQWKVNSTSFKIVIKDLIFLDNRLEFAILKAEFVQSIDKTSVSLNLKIEREIQKLSKF
jgi:hypothetical protein